VQKFLRAVNTSDAARAASVAGSKNGEYITDALQGCEWTYGVSGKTSCWPCSVSQAGFYLGAELGPGDNPRTLPRSLPCSGSKLNRN